MKQSTFYFILLIIFSSCWKADPEIELARFLTALEEHEEQYMPESRQLVIFDSLYQKNRLQFAKKGSQKLAQLDTLKLSPSSLVSYKKAVSTVAQSIEDLEQNQIYQKDPSQYDVGPNIQASALPSEQILQDSHTVFEYNLRAVPPFYQTAKAQLDTATIEKIKAAIQVNRTTYLYLSQQLIPQIEKIKLDGERKDYFLASLDEARIAVKDYIAFCKSLEFEYFDQKNNSPPIQ